MPHIHYMNIDNLLSILDTGEDSLILRFGIAQALINLDKPEQAIEHLMKALEFDPEYSAAYKLLGKAYALTSQDQLAIDTYTRGIQVAEGKGDIQASKEMKVFLKRINK